MAPARAADVVSSNIVGYQKLDLDAGAFVMSGIQFVKVGEDNGTLNDLFTSGDIPFGTEIRFLDSDGVYQIYKYIEEAYDEDADDFVPGWGDGSDYLSGDVNVPGEGFWVKAPSNYKLTQSGEVFPGQTATVTVEAGIFTMICNPFLVAFNPNDVNWGTGLQYGTEIRVLDDAGVYQFYKYIEEAYDEDLDDFVPGWGDGEDFIVKAAIADIGQGFWIKSPSKLTLTFSNPAK